MRLRWFNIITLTLGGENVYRGNFFVTLICITVFMFNTYASWFFNCLFFAFWACFYWIFFFLFVSSPITPLNNLLTKQKRTQMLFISGIHIALLKRGNIAVAFPTGLDVRQRAFPLLFLPCYSNLCPLCVCQEVMYFPEVFFFFFFE